MSSSPFPQRSAKLFPPQPLDRIARILMVALAVFAIALIILGDHATARVQAFSWQDRTVGANDSAFTLTFTRPMDPQSVAANLQITPYLPGKVSWAGRRMAYTLDVPIPYGETYSVKLSEARDRFSNDNRPTQFESFVGTFQSRDRALVYIGTKGDEAGRLVMVNFSQRGKPILLTPANLSVLDFEPYPLGDRLLFSAVKTTNTTSDNPNPDLYTVATGLAPAAPKDLLAPTDIAFEPAPVGTLVPILQSNEYQNLAFDLSPNGQIIVVQRIHQNEPGNFGPWILIPGQDPKPLNTEPGGEFLIGPDSQSLLMLQGQGTAIIPLETPPKGDRNPVGNITPLDFLPEFGRVFDITKDGSAAAFVNFNQNDPEKRFTETLTVVTSDGETTELLNVTGSILDAQFDPTNRIIYILASELLPGENYQEQPFLEAINLQTKSSLKLLTLPPQTRVSMDISPDGLAMLLEVAIPNNTDPDSESSQIILLPLFATTDQRLTATPSQTLPQVLPYSGRLPTWLP